MMAAAAEDGGSRQQWWRRTTTAADDKGGWMMTAHEIERRTTRGKEESGRQTATPLPLASRAESVKQKKEIEFRKKDFFQQYSLSGWRFCSRLKQTILLLDLSVINLT
jgi:hypothetical protein